MVWGVGCEATDRSCLTCYNMRLLLRDRKYVQRDKWVRHAGALQLQGKSLASCNDSHGPPFNIQLQDPMNVISPSEKYSWRWRVYCARGYTTSICFWGRITSFLFSLPFFFSPIGMPIVCQMYHRYSEKQTQHLQMLWKCVVKSRLEVSVNYEDKPAFNIQLYEGL